jgi:hypothetical protein
MLIRNDFNPKFQVLTIGSFTTRLSGLPHYEKFNIFLELHEFGIYVIITINTNVNGHNGREGIKNES